MILIDAQILEIHADQKMVVVEPILKSQCSICNYQECGAVSFTQLFMLHHRKKILARLQQPFGLYQVGQKVVLEISEKHLLQSVLMAYLMPLILILIGSGIGAIFNEFYSILGFFLGILISMLVLRFFNKRLHSEYLPIIKYHLL